MWINFEEEKKHDRVESDVDVLLNDRPNELKRVQENRAFVEQFKKEPIADDKKIVKAFGKDVNLNAVLKLNVANWNEFTMDNLCDMFCSWKIAQLSKYLKKKTGLDFNWTWLFILIILGFGGLIFVIMFILPKLQGVVT